MKITLAENSGYCYGVKRAVEAAENECKKPGEVYSFGKIIHNTDVIDKLEKAGMKTAEAIEQIPDGSRVIIRAHGVGKSEYEQLERKGCVIIDATCPNVKKIHKIVSAEHDAGRKIIIIGNKNHAETRGIAGMCGGALIISDSDDLDLFEKNSQNYRDIPLSVVTQTTMKKDFFTLCMKIIKKTCTDVHFFDTICSATSVRQKSARELAEKSDLMVVIGDRLSENTKNLADICSMNGARQVLFVKNAEQIDLDKLKGFSNIGVTAGASSPEWVIKEVLKKMNQEANVITEQEENFADLLEKSFKTLNTGEKVTGTVISISGNEIQVDLGYKHAGFINVSEISDDPSFNPENEYKIGDQIQAVIVRVNDVEGVITLSKKRLDAENMREKIEAAAGTGEVFSGVVVDNNRGGVIVSVSGVRVFVPASQSGLPKEADMTELLKKKTNLVITEYDKKRKRIVGSIRAAYAQERAESAQKVWDEIYVGAKYTGTVKSIMNYGAFVDIGGVDGLVHVSEMSWRHIKNPNEIMKVGQTVNVYVIAVDKEKKKISLGYRLPEDNPWLKFEKEYNVGDVVNVKIVKFMPFGAFAEIIPGVDGLIHISQICDRRISRPAEVLTIGQTVDAKIIDIDNEKKNISLSITAANQQDADNADEEQDQDNND